jgi:hypothetical protein
MEIYDEIDIQIFHTLEKIKRINKHIHLHQNADEPDDFAIEQWQEIRNDLTRQLQEMLAKLQVTFPVAA